MGRPTDWQPLADSDPVPGDPAGISAEAARLSSVAREIASQVAVLHKIAAGQSDEKGQHIEKLKAAAADTAGQLHQVSGRYQQTAAALGAWAPELEYAQARSLQALAAAKDAAARQQASQPVQRPPGTKLTPADRQADQARAQSLQQASADLAAARSMLDDAVAHRDQKAGETASKIESAASAGADHWWESLWDDIKSLADRYAWLIKDICTVLEVIATVLAIVALFIPGLDILVALGIAATLLAVAGRAMLAATGNGSWFDVALDVVALATFGIGGGLGAKILGGGLRGALEGATTAARTEAEAAGMARLLSEARPVLDIFYAFTTTDGATMMTVAGRASLRVISQSMLDAAKVPEFAEFGPRGVEGFDAVKAAFSSENIQAGIRTVFPRVAAGGDEAARSSAQALSYIGEHFPEVDTSAASHLLSLYRLNYGIGSGLPLLAQVAGGLEIDGPGGPTPVNWHLPVIGQLYSSTIDGSWTTTAGGLPIFR